ncbi:hypothetical protein AJ80_03601 [Polytolypa hystricis UAMH7299]|uniref:GPI anchored cell wall protein n=1 Tax=Polytolypa hystricis (strain UAMH7299) TaxID=1447883 RepID=A0A2B7YH31_POLH7|nr:hypothetical protein AJ80_03601 [Polytolypa hystricis UAMH7299]
MHYPLLVAAALVGAASAQFPSGNGTDSITTLPSRTLSSETATFGPGSTEILAFGAGPTSIPFEIARVRIIDANAIATTYEVDCAQAAGVECALDAPVRFTEGPSTLTQSAVFSMSTMGVRGKITLVQDCDITSSTEAACYFSERVEASSGKITQSTSTEGSTTFGTAEIFYYTMTVTAGAEKLSLPKATQTPTGSDADADGDGDENAAVAKAGMSGAAIAFAVAAAMGFF